jgi:photosystem II stability/assembly factor-like uncharacterized protein
MKKLLPIVFLVFFLSSKNIYSQGWQAVNVGMPSNLYNVTFADDNVVYILPWTDSGPLIKSTNGGLNWFNITGFETTGFYRDAFFLNKDTGFCAGSYTSQFKSNFSMTTNGGISWTQKTYIPSQTFGIEVSDIHFIDINTGFAVTYAQQSFGLGHIYKTINGGANWTEQIPLIPHNPWKISFINNDTGIVACDSGFVLKTTNGGSNWQSQYLGVNTFLYDIEYLNPDTIFIVSNNSRVFKSFDGGNNWVLQSANPPSNIGLRNISFINNSTGVIFARATSQEFHTLVTTNGGESWKDVNTVNTSSTLVDFDASNSMNAVMVGLDGAAYYSSTLGVPIPGIPILQLPSNNSIQSTVTPTLRWQAGSTAFNYNIQISTDSTFNSAININSDTIIVKVPICNLYNFNKYFWRVRSSNLAGVSSWSQVRSFHTKPPNGWYKQETQIQTENLNCLTFVDTLKGWSVGTNGKILHTTSGGDCWIEQSSGSSTNLNSIHFSSENTGITVGDSGVVSRTTDGGSNWEMLNNFTSQDLKSILFINTEQALFTGGNGIIFKTTNSGQNWLPIKSNVNNLLSSIFFVNPLTGWIIGNSGTILKTNNGGLNWTLQNSGLSDDFNDIYMHDQNTGWVVGDNGKILKTIDGGSQWTSEESTTTMDLYSIMANDSSYIWISGEDGTLLVNSGTYWELRLGPTSQNLTSICFLDYKGWISGDNGVIIHTTNVDIISSISSLTEIPADFLLLQNYPNPFNPVTNISFELPRSSYTKLIVYDVLGKELLTLENKELPAGKHLYQWDASEYSTGIYFYRLEAGEFIETKRMVLVK